MATSERQKTSFRLLTFVLIFLGIDGMWQYVFGSDLLRHIPFEQASAGPRISASFKNYGLLASFLISFSPLLGCRLSREDKAGETFLKSLGFVLSLLLLFWTRVRGAWVAFWGGLLFLALMQRKKIYFLLLLLPLVAIPILLPRSMVIHLDAEGKEQSLVERFYLWDRAVQVIQARPWTGTGINTYAVAHQKYDQRQNWRVQNYYAHNGYLQMAAETGLPSLACFLTFLFFYFLKGLRFTAKRPDGEDRRTLAGIYAGIVNFLVLAIIDTIFHNPQAVLSFWFLAGWGLAYQRSVGETR
ncbi:MAG: O-antigen ligase family protein [Candidatus Omnitrophica bacterium]|nr:O-antigen ligase family protein [Candidatus Omnitrophota bacterium]